VTRSSLALGLLVASSVLALAPRIAVAASKAECVAAYEEGQQLRAKGALRDAREEFLVCADPACPNATRGQCTQWVTEVDQSMPTVTFAVTEDGKDVTDVAVFVDDKPLATSLDGKALPIDPGAHKVRVERGAEKTTMDVVIREGEKNRALELTLGEKGPTPQPEQGLGSLSPGVWVLGGIGVAGLGLFGVMGGVGLSEKSDAEDTCAPNCSDSEVGSIRAKFIVADVALGVGIASLGGAVILGTLNLLSGDDSVSEDRTASRPFDFTCGPLAGGAYVGVDGRF